MRISRLRVLVLAGSSGVVVGIAVLLMSIASVRVEPTVVLASAAVMGGLGALLIAVLVGHRSLQHSHDLLRKRTLRTFETTSDVRAALHGMKSSIKSLSSEFVIELDKRQLEWFEAAEILEQKISEISLPVEQATTLERIEQLDADTSQKLSLLEQKISEISLPVDHLFTRQAITLKRIEQLDADTSRDLESRARQIEAVTRICTGLPLRQPLPPFGDWAVSPDFAAEILRLIFKGRPRVVVEVGSGLSTILIGYALEALGQGRLISLEHDMGYWSETSKQVQSHGLTDVVDVVLAPLTEYALGEHKYLWYAIEDVNLPDEIDMLVVDGPPTTTNRHARYPALPLLEEKLAPGAQIIVDDARRVEEMEIIKLWQSEAPGWSSNELDLERGAVILTRNV